MKHQLANWMSYFESSIIALPLCKISCLYLFYLQSFALFVAATFFGTPMHHENLPMLYTGIFSEAKIENFIGKSLIFLIF